MAAIANIVHELRVSGDSTEEQWADEIERIEAKYNRLRDAVKAVCDGLEEQYDYADDTGPNWAMRIGTELKEALYGPGGF